MSSQDSNRSTSDEDTAFIANLEEKGVTQVRQIYAVGGWATALIPAVNQWLSEKDVEERVRNDASRAVNDASQAAQTLTARSANKAAWIAAMAAIVAAVVATIAAIISYLAWAWPHS